jgi:hypothetical protein
MRRFASPALNQPGLHLPALALRGLFVLAAAALAAGLWVGAGVQAGQFGGADRTPRFELEPVVISGHRVLPDAASMAMGSTSECGNPAAGGGRNGVTLSQ